MEGQQVYSQNQHWWRREGKEVVLRNPCNMLQLPEPAIYIKLERINSQLHYAVSIFI